MAKAVSAIGSAKPRVLSVNEACAGDVARLQDAMGASQSVFFAALRRDGAR